MPSHPITRSVAGKLTPHALSGCSICCGAYVRPALGSTHHLCRCCGVKQCCIPDTFIGHGKQAVIGYRLNVGLERDNRSDFTRTPRRFFDTPGSPLPIALPQSQPVFNGHKVIRINAVLGGHFHQGTDSVDAVHRRRHSHRRSRWLHLGKPCLTRRVHQP